MIEIRSSLSDEELDEFERTQTHKKVSLNLSYLKNLQSFRTFLNQADVIVVDDALSFDINAWEESYIQEMCKDIDEPYHNPKSSSKKFTKYKLDDNALDEVMGKLKKSDLCFVDGKTSWKTRQFMKTAQVELSDLQEAIHNLSKSDYATNSKPIDEDIGYNEAIIFIKDSKIKDLGPLHLYIKLDYDIQENTPVIVISFHQSGGK